MPNILDQSIRKAIIQEIEGKENIGRKAEHQKRSEIYKDKQRKYVLEMLSKEFPNSINSMRTCTSINLTKRVINEMASIYKRDPDRKFYLDNGAELTEDQQKQLDVYYEEAQVNTKLKSANQKFKLHHQCAVQIIPKSGSLYMRALAPYQYDVVPMDNDPEVPYCYILSTYDKKQLYSEINSVDDVQGTSVGGKNKAKSDTTNQAIADEDDWRKKKIYSWWSAEYNFLTNDKGEIVSDLESISNPIQMLPFVDVACGKDYEFWVDQGSAATEFNLDFLVTLSDTCNTNRLQSYAQPVISAEELPEDVKVGPNHILFLKLNPDRPEIKPTFDFANPQPDMNASLELQDRLLNYFLTSNGIDPKTVSGKNDSTKYASGVERLLSMIDKFEATQDDFDLFKKVESDILDLFIAWNFTLQGTDMLEPEYQITTLPAEIDVTVQYHKPEVIQTKTENEDSTIKLLEAGLLSKVEAIAQLRGVSMEQAQKLLKEIDIDLIPTQGA